MRIALYCLCFFVFFILLPAAVITLFIFKRKKILDFDEAPERIRWSDYLPYKETILADIAFLRSLSPKEVRVRSFDGTELCSEWFDMKSSRTCILLHGFCATPYNNFAAIGRAFIEHGMNILLVHQRAHGKSGGKGTTLGLLESADLITWIDRVKELVPGGKLTLYGISMGATSIAYASDRLDPDYVKSMVIDCGYSSPYDQMYRGKGAAALLWAPIMPFIRLFSRWLVNVDIRESILPSLQKTVIPAFFLVGLSDRKVPPKLFRQSYEACASEKELCEVSGAHHALAFAAADEKERKRIFDFIEKGFISNKEAQE